MAKDSKMAYAKNASKSLASAGVDAVGDLMPNLKRGIKSNKSLALNTYKKYKEDSTPFDIQKTYLYKSTKRLIENAINDTKSGNFNNKKREAENDSFANMFNLDFDFDNNTDDSISMGDSSGSSFDMGNLMVNADFDEETKFDIKSTANISKANLRVTNLGFATVTNQLKIINSFHNNNTVQFYNSMEEKVAKLDETMGLVGRYLTDLSENSSRSNQTSRKARKSDAFQMSGISIQDWIELYSKGSNKEKGGMNSMFEFFIKPEIEKLVANPMGWASKTAMKAAMPKKLKNSMKDADQLVGMLPMLAQGKFKDWSKNGNFLQKTLGNLLNLDKFKTKANKFKYEKGVIGFDGITKRAITHVIPGYLSRILTALTQNAGDKNLAYDFDSGKFVNSKEAKKHYKASLENEIRGNIQSSDKDDQINRLKADILAMAKEKGTTDDAELAKLNERLDQMMVGMTKRGMTFGNTRTAKDLNLDEDTAGMVMQSYNKLKGKQQAEIEKKLATAWVDYEKKLDDLTGDSLFQSVYDRKSFNKKDSQFKKSKVEVTAKVDDTISQVGSLINNSNISDSKKSFINKALNKASSFNDSNKTAKGYDKVDDSIDKLFKFFTDSGNSYGKEESSSNDASDNISGISKNISDLTNIAMSGLALDMNNSGDKSSIKFSKSMFNSLRSGKGRIVRAKIYSKMTAAKGKTPTVESANNDIKQINVDLPKIESLGFNEDINNLRPKDITEKKPVKVVVVGGNIDKVAKIEDIKELADPKNPNSANEQRAKMREESKLRQELMNKNALDGHENVVTSSLKELMNPEGAGGGSGSGGGIFKEIIGEVAGSTIASALPIAGGITGMFSAGLGKLGNTAYSSKLGGKILNTNAGSGILDLATNGVGFKGNVKNVGMKGLSKVKTLGSKGLSSAKGLMGKAPGLMGKVTSIGGKAMNLAGGLGGKAMGLAGSLGGKVTGLGGKALGGLGKVAGLGGKAAGVAGGAAKAAGGLGKVAGLAGGAAKFLGPVGLALTAAQGLTGGIKGFKNAGETFGKLPGEKVTLGEKLSGGVGGTLSALSFGLLNKDKMAKGIHGIGSGIGKLGKTALKYSPIGLMGSAMGKLFNKKDKEDEKEDKDPDKKSVKGRKLASITKLTSVIAGGPFIKLFGARGLFDEAADMAKKSEGGSTGFFKNLFKKKTTGSDGGSANNGDFNSGSSGVGTKGFGYKGLGIHALTGKMETSSDTGGKADMISTGANDPGGKSYGAFQFSSVYNGQMGEGSVKGFVNGLQKHNMDWYNRLSKHAIGSAGFDEEWKKIAAEDYDGFYKVQEQSIIETHYTPTANAIKPIIDVDKYSDALQSEIMSLGTQFGPGGPQRNNGAYGVVNRAIGGKDLSRLTEREILNYIFDEKARTNSNNGQGYLNSSRVDQERIYVMEILDEAERRVAAGGPLNPSMGSIGGGTATGTIKSILDIYQNDIVGVKYFLGNPQNHQLGFDCSGSIQYAYEKAGFSIPGTTYVQRPVGKVIGSIAEARPGDLLFSRNNEHVTMYAGDGMVYAEESKGGRLRKIGTSSKPWGDIVDGSAGIRRYIDDNGNVLPEAAMNSGVYKLKNGEKPGRSRNQLSKFTGGTSPQGDSMVFSRNMGITSGQAARFRKEATATGPDSEVNNVEKHSTMLDVKNVLTRIKKTGKKTNEILEKIIDVVVNNYGVI